MFKISESSGKILYVFKEHFRLKEHCIFCVYFIHNRLLITFLESTQVARWLHCFSSCSHCFHFISGQNESHLVLDTQCITTPVTFLNWVTLGCFISWPTCNEFIKCFLLIAVISHSTREKWSSKRFSHPHTERKANWGVISFWICFHSRYSLSSVLA